MSVTSNVRSGHPIGVSQFHVAKITADAATGVTYDSVVAFPELISVQIEPQNQESSLYADNVSVDVASSTPEYNITIETAQLPLEYKSLLLGHTFADGQITASGEDTPPYFGISFESIKSDGTKRYFKFLKVKFQENNENAQTKGDQISFQTASLTGKAIFRAYDSKVYTFADENEGATVTNWHVFPSEQPSP
jgi:phi13 family phage major tail protein